MGHLMSLPETDPNESVTISGADLAMLGDENRQLRAGLKALIRAYVNTMENARDRIVGLGGRCDPVDVMERADPALRAARTALGEQIEREVPVLTEAQTKLHRGMAESGKFTVAALRKFTGKGHLEETGYIDGQAG